MNKSEVKTIVVEPRSSERGFEKAIDLARREAIRVHGIDESGNCKDSENFPRSSSEVVVEFVGMRFTLNMGGGTHEYEFKTWMENFEDEKEE